MSRDSIYSFPRERVGEFAFDQTVVAVFPDMIARSVPGYASMLAMIEQLTDRFARPGTQIYDLGCSLGAATRLIRARAPRDCTVHAIDNAPAMIDRLRELMKGAGDTQAARSNECDVRLHLADVREFPIERASFVVMNLTLQFVPVEDRHALIENIYGGLIPGGALLLSEKLCFEDAYEQQLLTELHHDFKRAHGYSDLEIAQKRTALENRLVPETMSQHCARLAEVGFQQIAPWFQCFNFASILAVK